MVSNFWVLTLYGVSSLFAGADAAALRFPVYPGDNEDAETQWGAIWTAAPQLVEPENLPPEPFV